MRTRFAAELSPVVRAVLSPSKLFTAQGAADLLSAHPEEGTQDADPGGAGVSGDVALAQDGLAPEAGEAPDVRTAHPAHEQGLHGVVLVVSGEDHRDACRRGLGREGLVASLAGPALHVTTLRVDLGHAPGKGDPELGAQARTEGRVVVGLIAPEAMVHVDGEDLGAVLRTSEEMEEVDAVGASAEGDRDRRGGGDSQPMGQATPAGGPRPAGRGGLCQ